MNDQRKIGGMLGFVILLILFPVIISPWINVPIPMIGSSALAIMACVAVWIALAISGGRPDEGESSAVIAELKRRIEHMSREGSDMPVNLGLIRKLAEKEFLNEKIDLEARILKAEQEANEHMQGA